ncbi:MAG: sulfatase [Bacteroidota bacterium]
MRYCLLFLLLLGCKPEAPPNIILIFADDLGYADLGSYGATTINTPHLDALAADGVRLTNFYVSSPVCSASRAALLTGSYHRRVGISGALNPHSKRGLNNDEITIAEMLKPQGYATAAVGKWHLGHLEPFLPTNHGFDSYFGIPYSNDMSPDPANNPRERARKWPPLPLVQGLDTIEKEPNQSMITQRYTSKAVDFIKAHTDQPFFLYLAHTMPHVPLYTAPEFQGTSVQGAYGDVIQEIDWSTGELLKTLEEEGLADNTLVIFTSDNGPWRVFGNHGGECGPLRGRKGSVWECGIRVPFIARWPGHIPASSVQDAPAMTIDMLPTLAQLSRSSYPADKIDGKNVWPLLTGQSSTSPHKTLFFYYAQQLQALRHDDWKLQLPHTYRKVDIVGADGMPGTYTFPATGLELYNLATNPGESIDVASAHPELVAYLTGLADSMRHVLGDKPLNITGSGIRPASNIE